MSLDLNEVKGELRNLGDQIDPDEDYYTIVAAEKVMAERAKERKRELDEVHGNLKALARVLDAARASAKRPPTVPTAEQHVEHLNRIEAEHVTIVKLIHDEQRSLDRTEGQLEQLKQEARELEVADAAAGAELDGTALRLQFMKGLGATPVFNSQKQREKVLIRGTSNEVYIAKQERGESAAEFSDRAWTLASK